MTTRVQTMTLVGRDDERASLRAILAEAAAGSGRTVFVEGEAGIGKTRLVLEALTDAAEIGFRVCEATCDDLERTRPFAALARALGVTTDEADGDQMGATPGVQFRIIEALGAVVERLSADGPVVLVVQDLQWADASTLAALRSIARRIDPLPVVIIGTFRSGHGVGGLDRLVDDLLRAGGTRIPLGPLDEDAVASLITELVGGQPDDALLVRAKGARGNPLFLTEYVRALSDDDSEAVPLEFQLTVLRRLGHLPDPVNDLLRLASVLGSSFSPADLSVVTGRSLVDLAAPLQLAVDAGIIENRAERLAFCHDLVRDAVYEHVPLAVRTQLHREAGRALAAAGGRPLVVAHHLALGAESRDPEAAGWLRRAASETAPRAPAVAVELLERARDLLGPSSPDRNAVLAELVMALAWSGRLVEAEALGLEVLQRRPGPEVAGPLRCGLVYALIWQGRSTEALRHTEVGTDEQLSEADAAHLLALSALASLFAFDIPSAGAKAARATAAAEAIGHDLALCHGLSVQVWVAGFQGRHVESMAFANRAIAIADASEGGEPHLAHPRFFPGMGLVALDRLDEAEDVMQTGRRISEELGLVSGLPLYHTHLGAKRFVAGDLDGAVAELEAGLAIADEVGMSVGVMSAASGWLAVIQLLHDDLEGAEATLARAVQRMADPGSSLGLPILNWARAMVREARGDAEEGLALLQTAWDTHMATGKVSNPWSCMALVRMCVRTGQAQRAAALLPLIDAQAAAEGASSTLGLALRCRGLVENDPAPLIAAVEAYRASPRRLDLAAACEDAGILLAELGRTQEAVPFLDEAMELYRDVGATRDETRVRAELRKAGAPRVGRHQRARVTRGWDSLTRTELKVLALVAQRLTNPEVAERLFISRHTVESHLKHIYRKLELSSRLDLAAEAARHAG